MTDAPSRFDWRGLIQRHRWRLLWSAVWLVVLLALFWYAAQRLSVAEIGSVLQQADMRWLLLTVVLLCASQAARALRWGRLLGWEAPSPALELARALMGGQVINWLLPIRVGDIWRVWQICRSGRHSVLWGAGSIVVEKSADLLVLAGFAAALAFVPLPEGLPVSAVRLVATACAGLLIVSPLIFLRPSFWRVKVLRRWPSLQKWYNRLRARVMLAPPELAPARNPLRWFEVMAVSFAIWGLAAASNMALARAFHIQVEFTMYIVLLLALQFSTIVSAAPANLGVFPLVALGVLPVAGVDQAQAIAFGSALYVLVYGVNLALFGLTIVPWHKLASVLARRDVTKHA